MSVECFLDTNVFVYALSAAPEDAAKKAAALALIEQTDFGVSTQVLQELYVTVTGKIRVPLAPDEALAFLDELRAFPSAPADYPLIVSAIELSLRHRVHYWDGAILAAAEALEAPILYTEDFGHGRRYGAVEARNPFRE